MVTSLQELDAIGEHLVDEAIGLVDAPRPRAAAEVFEVFRLAEPAVRVSQRGLDQVPDPERRLAVGVDPITQVLEAFILEDGFALAPGAPVQAPATRPSSRRRAARSFAGVRPRRARVRAASNRAAFVGERRR